MSDVAKGEAGVRGIRGRGALFILTMYALVFSFEYCVLRSALAQHYFVKGKYYLEKAHVTPSDLLVKRVIFYQVALKSIRKSLALNPAHSKGYSTCGQIIAEIAGDDGLRSSVDAAGIGVPAKDAASFYGVARAWYIQAVASEPTNPIYHLKLGQMYDLLSDTKKAEDEMERAVKLDPLNITVHLFLSQYYKSRGNDAKFNLYFQKMIELGNTVGLRGGGPMADAVLPFLRSIGKEDLLKR